MTLSSRSEAINLVNDIVSNYNYSNLGELSQNCIKLTKHLFNHQYLLYSDLNLNFESSGVLIVMMKSLDRIDEQPKRDVLRLIHLLLQANRSLRDTARQYDDFQTFLRRHLESSACWTNGAKFKHHINIASLLLTDRDSTPCSFNKITVRAMVIRKIESAMTMRLTDNEDILISIVFYACSMFTSTYEEIPTNNEGEPDSDRILTKELTGRCLDILRDYVQDFKLFYDSESDVSRSQYVLYKAKSEFSFQQICSTIIFHSVQSKSLRMNVYQGGLYAIINHMFYLINIPEPLLAYGIDILKLSTLDDGILSSVKKEFLKSINTKLNLQLQRPTLSNCIKSSINDIIKVYDNIPDTRAEEDPSTLVIPTGQFIRPKERDEITPQSMAITLGNLETLNRSNSYGYEQWSLCDVQRWLSDNRLDDCKEVLSHLTGGGLKQLKVIGKENDKIKFVEFLMNLMRIRFDTCLELISAVEKL